ncbi:pirin family protein [Halomonas sp. YLGW01]|uniref:pirin family protein n=1 Tax=Halomonas sp. YLGW01 TaxID=2773308 RepID=UPI00177BC3CB|nr:pirin family protein [Halomonas sp. YLGW01]
MSNTDQHPDASNSRDCPLVHGERVCQRIRARGTDVGGIPVARALPTRERRRIGAWCFLDHIGPVEIPEGAPGLRVGPHPHIGLQTFTWMIEGELLHRDSLSSAQPIRPGQVNLMTAGRGIAHTEESLQDTRRLHAAQLWIALPRVDACTSPRFDHYPVLPRWNHAGMTLTLLAGELLGHRAPTLAFSELMGLEIYSPVASEVTLSLDTRFEYGLLVLVGEMEIGKSKSGENESKGNKSAKNAHDGDKSGGERFAPNELAYLGQGRDRLTIKTAPGSRALLLGGEPDDEEILIWWNFVGRSRDEIIRAQQDWESGSERFPPVPGFQGPRLDPPPLPWKAEEPTVRAPKVPPDQSAE